MAGGLVDHDTAACPGDETIARFVDEALPPAAEQEMRAHIERCASCRRRVAQMGAGGSGSERIVREISPPTQTAERDDLISAGSLIGGKYRVVREVGAGGMGKVFAAVHIELGQTVAIKLMHSEMAREPDSVRRFLREGRAAALLKSDHAVRINDVGRLPSGIPYLVMEYLEGEDLDRLRKRHILAIDDVVDYMLQAITAVAEAHDAGIIHRDIKPQNLFLARLPDGELRVKVLDFGLAKELPTLKRGPSANSALTTEHMILGSPHFMSPEQIRTPMDVDARTDVWALGATMFLLVTGRPPYTSNTVHGLLARILADPPPRARDLRADVPAALDDVISRCLEKDVFARFQSVTDLAAAVRASVGREGSGAQRRASGSSARLSASKLRDAPPRTVQEGIPPTLDDAGDPDLDDTQVRPPSMSELATAGLTPPPEHDAAVTLVAAGGAPQTRALVAAAPPQPATPTVMAAGVFRRTEPMEARPSNVADTAQPVAAATLPEVAVVPAPPRAARRSVRTAALVVFTMAAIAGGLLMVRNARSHDATNAQVSPQPESRALPAAPSATTAASSPASSSSSSVPALASASAAPSATAPLGTTASTVPARRPKTPPTSATTATPATDKDPYSWGK